MRLKFSINLSVLLAVVLMCAILFLVALNRTTIDRAPVWLLPSDDAALTGAGQLLGKSWDRDWIAIDIATSTIDPARLQTVAAMVVSQLAQSGFFEQVGNGPSQQRVAGLADHVVKRLPVLFTAGQLQQKVLPLLTDDHIRRVLTDIKAELGDVDHTTQASGMIADPLGLRHIVLDRLAAPQQTSGSTIQLNRIKAAERRHVMLLATPVGSGTDATTSRSLSHFFRVLEDKVQQEFGSGITLTTTAAIRQATAAAPMATSDLRPAILWATLGIGILLLWALPRPILGLIALLPAMAGTALAFFIFSLINDSIPIMVLGLGGACNAISMTHSVAYLLLVNRSPGQKGRQASRDVRWVGLPPVLIAAGAFGVVAFSGLAVFEQLGWFSVMSIGFSFLFVHTVFPRILVADSQAAIPPRPSFSRIVVLLTSTGKAGIALALLAAVVLGGFIRHPITVGPGQTNRINRQAPATEGLKSADRGDPFPGVYLMTEASNMASLQDINDRLLEHLDTETHAGSIERAITLSRLFPGRSRRSDNFEAWRQFWTQERIQKVSMAIKQEGAALGLAHSAYDAFLKMLAVDSAGATDISPGVLALLGITRDETSGRWRQVTRITPRERFDNQRFYDRIKDMCAVYDPVLLSQLAGRQLFDRSMKMLMLIGLGLVFLLTLFLADAGLLLTTVLPLAFAAVCTLGTLSIMGRPAGLSVLVLPAIILGMGAVYPLFMVRSCQRYQQFDDPGAAAIRTAVFLAAVSTLVGFAVLLSADHDLLKTAGWISFLGSGYCLAGTLLILPPLLKRRFKMESADSGGIDRRFRNMAPYPRMVARHKLRSDPLLDELATLVPQKSAMANILDVGCGYGVPACWLADRYPTATIHGIEPHTERLRVAALALGNRAQIAEGLAPDLPPMDVLVDLAIMLDVSHYLQDWEMEKTLERIHERLLPGGRLIMRSLLPPPARPHWTRHLANIDLKIEGIQACYRDQEAISAILAKCGFEVHNSRASGNRGDTHWHVAEPR